MGVFLEAAEREIWFSKMQHKGQERKIRKNIERSNEPLKSFVGIIREKILEVSNSFTTS